VSTLGEPIPAISGYLLNEIIKSFLSQWELKTAIPNTGIVIIGYIVGSTVDHLLKTNNPGLDARHHNLGLPLRRPDQNHWAILWNRCNRQHTCLHPSGQCYEGLCPPGWPE
jgi:hypothetical protein